jgi:hypothetical protein
MSYVPMLPLDCVFIPLLRQSYRYDYDIFDESQNVTVPMCRCQMFLRFITFQFRILMVGVGTVFIFTFYIRSDIAIL